MGTRIHLRLILFVIFLFSLATLSAQKQVQIVRGQVVDALSNQPLSDVEIQVHSAGQVIKTLSDSDGFFRLKAIPTRRNQVIASKPGYQTFSISDLEVDAGKEKVLLISLQESAVDPTINIAELETVTITSNLNRLGQINTRNFTIEETQRFAATYYDPARLVLSYPGVTATSDQANHISVRGNSPNGILWRLEGIDIVNPNHTANAGTNTDRVSQNGGGVLMLSTQLMANSSFSNGAFDPEYGNALSGVFDIQLRKGNDEQTEFTVQAGVIGIDLAAEGPLSKGSKSSFLVNYRYSTVGLLSAMGVDLGDETISYQDLSFNLNFPTERAGTFTLFGLGGTSSNLFEGSREDSTWEVEKDRFDIEYRSKMGVIGMTHSLLLGTRTLWKSALAASGIQSERTGDYLDDTLTPTRVESDQLNQGKISLRSSLTHKLNAQQHLEGGFFLTQLSYRVLSQTRPFIGAQDFRTLADAQGSSQLIQPYMQWTYQSGNKWVLKAGLHGMYFALNNTVAIEPRVKLTHSITNRSKVSLAYGLHSQLQLLGTYFATIEQADGSLHRPNESLGFTRAHHIGLTYVQQLGQQLSLKVEPYYQSLFNVPIVDDPSSTFSALNLLEGSVTDSLTNTGTGENYGIELSLEKLMNKGYYFLMSTALYESKYVGGDGIKRDTRFNGNIAASFSGGREFAWQGKRNKDRVVGINLRMIYQGGYRYSPIDITASSLAGMTIYDNSSAFDLQQANFFRTDLRLSFKKHKPGYTRTFSLDIQNLTNRNNVAFEYFDTFQQAVIVKNQLGIIPLLTYRLEF